jgi:hypothetical protein
MTRLLRCSAWLVLPLAALLFAQWPLRELVQAGSRQANDAAQVLFALLMAFAVSAATRAGVHLSAAHHATPRGGWRDWAVFACVAPWAVFLLWTSAPQVLRSLQSLERFPDTFNPGYFLLKLALWVLAALALADAVRTLLARRHG